MKTENFPRIRLKKPLPVLSDYAEGTLILITDPYAPNENEGAITTEGLYQAFKLNPAHLTEDGRILSHGTQLGTIEDLEITR